MEAWRPKVKNKMVKLSNSQEQIILFRRQTSINLFRLDKVVFNWVNSNGLHLLIILAYSGKFHAWGVALNFIDVWFRTCSHSCCMQSHKKLFLGSDMNFQWRSASTRHAQVFGKFSKWWCSKTNMSMSNYTYFRASFMLRNFHIQITLHLDPIPWPHNLRMEPCQVTCGDVFPKLNLKRKKCAILHKLFYIVCHHEIYFVCTIKPFILWYGHVSKERVRDSNFPTWPVTPKEGSFLFFLPFGEANGKITSARKLVNFGLTLKVSGTTLSDNNPSNNIFKPGQVAICCSVTHSANLRGYAADWESFGPPDLQSRTARYPQIVGLKKRDC